MSNYIAKSEDKKGASRYADNYSFIADFDSFGSNYRTCSPG